MLSGLEERIKERRGTGLGPTAAPGNSRDGESGVLICSQTTQVLKMATVRIVCCSLVTNLPLLIGMMLLATSGRGSSSAESHYVSQAGLFDNRSTCSHVFFQRGMLVQTSLEQWCTMFFPQFPSF